MTLKRLFFIAILLTLSLGITGISMAQTTSADILRIAYIGESTRTTSHDYAFYEAALLAAADINAPDDEDDGGVLDRDDNRYIFEIVYYEATTSSDAIEAYEDALDDDAIAILTHSSTVLSAIRAQGTPAVPILTGSPDAVVDTTTPNRFRLTAGYADYSLAAADYLIEERKIERVAAVTNNTSVALDNADVFADAAGDSLIAHLTHEPNERDFSAVVRTLRQESVEAIYVWTLGEQMTMLLEALEDSNWDGLIVYGGISQAFVEQAGQLGEGLYGITPWSVSGYDSASRSFSRDYQVQTSASPSELAAAYYDAINLIAEAVSASTNGLQIREYLQGTTDFSGVQGDYDGGSTDGVRVFQVRDGLLNEAGRYTAGECVSCPDLWTADTSDDSATNRATFNIAVIAPQDGIGESTGDNMLAAAQLAAREINERGGIIGPNDTRYTLNVRVYAAGDADEASSAITSALTDGMQAIVGPDANGQILSSLYEPESASTPLLTTAGYTRITADEPGDYVFQLRSTDDTLAASAADYVVEQLGYTRLATVAVRTDYGLDAARAFRGTATRSSEVEVIAELEHEVSADVQVTAEQLASAILTANVEVVSLWTTQPQAAALLRALDDAGWQGVAVYGYFTDSFAASLADLSEVEVLAPVTWWSASEDWASREFVSRYQGRYGELPLSQSANYYDAIYLLASALADVGGDSDRIQSWLLDQETFAGVTGLYQPASYGDGEMSRAVTLLNISGSGIEAVASYDDGLCWLGCD